MWDLNKAFKKYQVGDCKTHEEFMDKYYKHNKYKGRGEEYAKSLLESHQKSLLEDGVDYISKHESITGRIVSFYPRMITTNTCEVREDKIPYFLIKEVNN